MRKERLQAAWRPEANGSAATADLEELWLALAPREWTSLVVVPADGVGSVASLATALADVGTRLSRESVSALMLEADQDPAVVADLLQVLGRDRRRAALQLRDVSGAPALPPDGELGSSPRTIVAIPALAGAPLGAGVARAADVVVVAVALRRTRLADIRRTIELVGRERVAGCCVVP